VNFIGAFGECGGKRMAGFVKSDDFSLVFLYYPALFLEPGDRFFNGFVKIFHIYFFASGPDRKKSCFIDDIRKICAGRTARGSGDGRKIYFAGKFDIFCVNPQDLLTALHVRTVNHDLPVKTAGTKQSGIEHVGAVGRRKENKTG
jgi:hypothetical protein